MDEVNTLDFKRDRPTTYGQLMHRMPPAEAASLHNYPPHQSAEMAPPSWNPTPSPYNENPEHRPPPQDLAHQQQPYPHPQSYPPPGRDASGYPPEQGYSRQGSSSGPSRSPADPQQPHYPPINGNPHEPHYYPPQGPPEYRTQHPYARSEGHPNGTHPPPPPLHVATGHDMMTGPPQGPPSQYGPPSSAGPPSTPAGYYFDPYGAAQRRKPVRAAQACDSCRQRKAKCDEGRPECQHCKDNGLKCSYREIPPQKSEKQVLAITDKLEGLSDSVNMLIETQKAQDDKINRLLELGNFFSGQQAGSSEVLTDRKARYTSQTPSLNHTNVARYKKEDSQPTTAPQMAQASFTSGPVDPESNEEDKMDFSMPSKHTTAAHNLLNWPSIKVLIPSNVKPSFVMDTESERGLLRLYGCGEGEDKGDGHEGAPSPAGSSSSDGRRFDDEMTTSSSPHGVWGTGFIHSGPTSHQLNNSREHFGGVSPYGGLMLDSEAVDKYFRSYMDNMHILHPFLEARVLRHMIHAFKRKYSWDYRMQQPLTTSIGKRKREITDSPTPSMDDAAPLHHMSRSHTRHIHSNMAAIEHSVANAIVLLVIAIGKVCAYKEPLPGPATTSSIKTSTPHGQYSDLPMPMPHSHPGSQVNSPLNNQVGINGVVAPAVSSPANPQGKNMDAIPGLAYFAKAADILGELPGGVDVSHIQANLLAGLYMGQLARIFPSHYYISNACKACMILIESTPYTDGTMKPARRNLINFAFWSCMQLESDILAEVDLPPSGITQKEGAQHQQMPTGLTMQAIPESRDSSDELLRFYSYQIQLRRTMNSVHSTLYRHMKKKKGPVKPSQTIIEILTQNLDGWRGMLNDWNWDDNDHMSDNINEARMRGKYYGARYIIHRPALQWALWLDQASFDMAPSESPYNPSGLPSPAVGSGPMSNTLMRKTSDMGPPPRSMEPLEPYILNASKACVEAAVRSTTAFDRVPRRLIITNVFGTVHAQFGNMLVLSATYMSPRHELSSLVDAVVLRHLFDRTLTILHQHENISPVLAKDARILQHVKNNVFPPSYPPASNTSSFSSNR